jgi:aminomethyltransferase
LKADRLLAHPMPKRTALFELHRDLGGRFVEFAGYEMPVTYGSILDEHEAVRKGVGIFDVSHMGNLWVRGPEAPTTLSAALVGDIRKVPAGGTKYSTVLRDDGTILDDLYVFHLPNGHHVIPNAGRAAEVAPRIQSQGTARVEDVSDHTAILAIQGPKAEPVASKVVGQSLAEVKRFHLVEWPAMGNGAFVSRTGYTGEDGFELVFPAKGAPDIFRRALAEGAKPCGLGARDTLRLEKGYCLAGNEFAGGRTPLEAGLSWLVDWDHDFAGKAALAAQKERGGFSKLVGIRLRDRGVPRHGNEVQVGGKTVGTVTSGTMSPTLREGIALAYVEHGVAKAGTPVAVLIRDRPAEGTIVKLPFV